MRSESRTIVEPAPGEKRRDVDRRLHHLSCIRRQDLDQWSARCGFGLRLDGSCSGSPRDHAVRVFLALVFLGAQELEASAPGDEARDTEKDQ